MDNMGRILKGLLRRTEDGKLKWKPSAAGESFVAAVDTIAVSVRSLGSEAFHVPTRYRLEVMNEQGLTVEALESPDTFGLVAEERLATGEQDGEMSRLFILARRSALDTDSTLQKLADRLESSP